jgi:outer membrane protein assembly factor BamB
MGSQRRLHGLLAALVAILWLLGINSVAEAQTSSESTGPLVDAGHGGYVYGAGVEPPLIEAWSINLGQNAIPEVAIDGGHVFTLESKNDGQGNLIYSLVSLYIATGQVSWSQVLGPVERTGAADVLVDGGRVFVAGIMAYDVSAPGEDGGYFVSGFNEQSGAPLWSDTLEAHDPGEFAAAVASGGVVYAQDGIDAYAIDESTGSYRWSTDLTANPNALLDSADSSLTLAGNVVFIGAGGCGTEEGLSTATGAILWSENTNSCTGGAPEFASVYGGDVWTPGSGATAPAAIYDPNSGANLGGFPTATPAFGYGEGVGIQTQSAGYSGSPVLEAFNPASEAALWTVTLQTGAPQNESGAAGQPLLADGLVFVATSPAYPVNTSSPQQVQALSPCTGAEVWDTSLPFATNEAPAHLAAGDGYLIVSGSQGELEALKGSSLPAGSAPVCAGSGAAAPDSTGSGNLISPTGNPFSPTASQGHLPTLAQVRRALRLGLATESHGVAVIAARRAHRYAAEFRAPSAGRLSIVWTAPRAGKSVRVARMAVKLSGARTVRLEVALSAEGRRTVASRRRLRVRSMWSFTPAGGIKTSLSRTVVLSP